MNFSCKSNASNLRQPKLSPPYNEIVAGLDKSRTCVRDVLEITNLTN